MKIWLTAIILLLGALGALLLTPQQQSTQADTTDLESMIPARFGDWALDTNIVPIAMSPDVKAKVEEIYDQTLSRTYIHPDGRRVMLSIAYGGAQTDSLKAHRQEVCYTSQGFNIREIAQGVLAAGKTHIPVTRMFAVNGARQEPVTYWFTMGNQVVLSRLERMLVQIKYGLSGEIPDGMLVRISNIGGDPNSGYAIHEDFARAMLQDMQHKDAVRLTGAPA